MGKNSLTGSSWLTIVKRTFRSPTKEKERKSCRRREEHDQEEEKKREKRRWILKKMNINNNYVQVDQPCETNTTSVNPISHAEQRHAIAVATATAATAQAAAEIVRLTRHPSSFVQEQWAAIVIQTAFRGYLARRSLRALKGLVKLQALVRGRNVRKQAKLTLKCMQAQIRVQDRVRDQRARLSLEGSRKSMFDETNNYNGLSLESRWLDRWMATKQLESSSASADHRREAIKTIEIDTSRPYSYSTPIAVARKSQSQNQQQRQPYVASPYLLRSHPNLCLHQQTHFTPSPCKNKPLQVRSASPRCPKEEKLYSAAHTPSIGSRYCYGMGASGSSSATCAMPNYMAATESAKARVRTQSAPRQRPSTPDRERGGSVKKRLSYPAPEPPHCSIGIGCSSFSKNLRSPSFKSVQAGHIGMEHRSNCSSCYIECISPCSTTDLRWLK